MRIDAHVHVFSPEFIEKRAEICVRDSYFSCLYESPRARMATGENLIQSMDEAAIDVSVLAGFGWSDNGICREHNDYVAECMRRWPNRVLGLAIANPVKGKEAEKELVARLEAGFAGIGELMPDGPCYSLDDGGVASLLGEIASAYDVPVLTHVSEPVGHLYAGKGTVSAKQIVSFAEWFPQVRLVCAHWGGGLPFFEMMPEIQVALANVFYDTAAWQFLYDDRIFHAASIMIPGKVLFATDYPLLAQAKSVMRVQALGLCSEKEDAYLGGNASKVYCRRC